jgi:hypothetical protein
MLPSNTKLTPSILQKHSFKAFLIKRIHQKRSRSKSDMQNQIKPSPTNLTKITVQPQLTPQPNPHPTSHPAKHRNATNVSLPSLYDCQRTKSVPPGKTRNIKGTVSGTFMPPIKLGEERVLRLTKPVCQRFVISISQFKNPLPQSRFSQNPPSRNATSQPCRDPATRP